MYLEKSTKVRARLAMREAVSKYLFDRNVSMIDFGFPEHAGIIEEDELAIRIHVHKKLSQPQLEEAAELRITQPIPEVIGGFPTDVPEGTYTTQLIGIWRSSNPRATRSNPMRGGISISTTRRYTYATLGSLVRDRLTGDEMILSNWHVLAGDWSARPGLGIIQPGRLDQGTSLDLVATLTRDAMDDNLDAAVARLNGSRPLVNDQMDLGPVTGLAAPQLGMHVIKSGRRTGVTNGRITAIDGVARIRYSWSVERLIRHIMTVEPHFSNEQTSQGGDSGSVWLNSETREAVGLHFAGSDFPERALAMDIQSVLNTLEVDLVTEVATLRPNLPIRRREPIPV